MEPSATPSGSGSNSQAPTVSVFYTRTLPDDKLSWGGDIAAILGYAPAELPRTLSGWHSLIHDDDRSIAIQFHARLTPHRAGLQACYRVKAHDGDYVLLRDEAACVDDLVIGTLRRVEAAEMPLGAELELIRFFELSLDLFGIATLEGYFTRVNSNFSRVLGYSEEELLTRPFLDFVHPDDRDATIAAMSKLSSGLPVVQFRNRYFDVHNDYRWLEWTARSVLAEGRIYAVARDVTEARLAEAQRIARVGSWEWRPNSDTYWWSDEYYRIFGYRVGEVTPSSDAFYACVHPEDHEKIKTWVAATLTADSPKSFDFRIVHPDGAERVIWTEARLERDAYGKPYRLLGTCQDITERRRAVEEKALLERKLQEAQKLESLGVLAGGIAHDFNNLLAAILGNASLIDMKLPANSPLRPGLGNILQATERAAALCRQMLAYSGRGRFVLAPLDLNRSVAEMTGLIQLSISKKVELRLELAPKLPAVMGDATQIGQVVMNLIINASEAIGDRRGQVRVATGVRHADDAFLAEFGSSHNLSEGPYVFLEVADTGCGMDEATRRKIFEPFYTTKFAGRGLGLAAVLGIVRGHKGAIKVESEPDVGTVFRLILPVDAGAAATPQRIAPRGEPLHGEGTVLVADDDPLVRETSMRILQSLGFRVLEAADGEEALARFREFPDAIRLVLLDLTMPKLDGEEVFRTLHILRPQLPVVLMSGYSELEASGRFAGAGLAGFLAKPFTVDALAASVRAALERGRMAGTR